jgi:hypothetical protein
VGFSAFSLASPVACLHYALRKRAGKTVMLLCRYRSRRHDDRGGGGVSSCSESLPALNGAPPYGDFEDMIIGGNLTITGFQTCWLGFFRDFANNVDFNDNLTGDPDGNEIATNTIRGNLSCAGNSPSPQIGDSAGGQNDVFGHAHGQCAKASLVR